MMDCAWWVHLTPCRDGMMKERVDHHFNTSFLICLCCMYVTVFLIPYIHLSVFPSLHLPVYLPSCITYLHTPLSVCMYVLYYITVNNEVGYTYVCAFSE